MCAFLSGREFVLLKQLDSTMAKYFGPSLPPTSWLEKRAALALINSNPTVDNSGPLLENVISVGGMHIKDTQQLPTVDSCSLNSIFFD